MTCSFTWMLMTDVPTQKKNLPILLPSMVEAENFSDHPCTRRHFSIHQNSLPSAFLGIVQLRLSHSLSGSYIPSIWEKEMMKTNSKISQFGLFVVNGASLMLYLKYVCFIQELNLSHWSCCGYDSAFCLEMEQELATEALCRYYKSRTVDFVKVTIKHVFILKNNFCFRVYQTYTHVFIATSFLETEQYDIFRVQAV